MVLKDNQQLEIKELSQRANELLEKVQNTWTLHSKDLLSHTGASEAYSKHSSERGDIHLALTKALQAGATDDQSVGTMLSTADGKIKDLLQIKEELKKRAKFTSSSSSKP